MGLLVDTEGEGLQVLGVLDVLERDNAISDHDLSSGTVGLSPLVPCLFGVEAVGSIITVDDVDRRVGVEEALTHSVHVASEEVADDAGGRTVLHDVLEPTHAGSLKAHAVSDPHVVSVQVFSLCVHAEQTGVGHGSKVGLLAEGDVTPAEVLTNVHVLPCASLRVPSQFHEREGLEICADHLGLIDTGRDELRRVGACVRSRQATQTLRCSTSKPTGAQYRARGLEGLFFSHVITPQCRGIPELLVLIQTARPPFGDHAVQCDVLCV